MTAFPARRSTLVPLLVVAGALVLAVSTQLSAAIPAADTLGLDEPLLDAPFVPEADDVVPCADPSCAQSFDPAAELDRVRADVTFWADRASADPASVT